jgi:8-hydroxy-5-deazaflavin:NADPH oxidoreductase
MLKIGILGTGDVGNRIGSKLISLNHDVKMGSRTVDNPKAVEWAKANGAKASQGTFSDAAKFGDVIFNCTSGIASIDALNMAGGNNLSGKVLVDISNPLDFSKKGFSPTLSVCNTDSLAEQIQRTFPEAKVVKALNTMGNPVMVNPGIVPGDHDVFICGNDAKAKTDVVEILKSFGWKNPIDLGDISAARGLEMVLPLWLRLYGIFQNRNFNFKIAK